MLYSVLQAIAVLAMPENTRMVIKNLFMTVFFMLSSEIG